MSAVLLGACATPAPADFSYSETSAEALIVLVAPPVASATEHYYRPVDIETLAFGEPLTKFRIGGVGSTPLIRNDTEAGLTLAVKEVPPGTYAVVENTRMLFTGYSTGTEWKCYTNSAVYEVRAGEITVIVAQDPTVQLRAAKKGPDLAAYVEEARKDYPNMKGEIVIAKPDVWIMWPKKSGNVMETMNRNCAEPETFAIRPELSPAPPSATPTPPA